MTIGEMVMSIGLFMCIILALAILVSWFSRIVIVNWFKVKMVFFEELKKKKEEEKEDGTR